MGLMSGKEVEEGVNFLGPERERRRESEGERR